MQYDRFQTALRLALVNGNQAEVNRLFRTSVKCAYCGNSTWPMSPPRQGSERAIRCRQCQKMWMKIITQPGGAVRIIDYGP